MQQEQLKKLLPFLAQNKELKDKSLLRFISKTVHFVAIKNTNLQVKVELNYFINVQSPKQPMVKVL